MSILRTCRFIKCIVSINRSIAVNTPKGLGRSLFEKSPLATPQFRYLRQVTSARPVNVEKSIQKLDQDVRKSGRITRKELDDTYAEMKNSKHVTSTQSLMIIRCCGHLLPEESPEVRTKLVQNIWTTLENMGVALDVSHYNALLRVYIENEYKFSPTEFLTELQNKNIEPNRVTFQRLITSYCQRGDIEGATRILEFMKEKQMPVNESVFSSLINGHFQAGDVQSAVQILNVMKQANIKPSADTYTVLMCGHARNGDINTINEVLAQIEKEEVDISDRDILEVIYSAAINNQTDLVDQLIPKLKKTPGYNQDARNFILRLVALGKDEAALKIFYSMVPIATSDGEPVPTGTFLIKQMVKFNRPLESILTLCSELKSAGTNELGLCVATEASLLNENPNLSLQLLTALSKEHEVCQHYYWPVLVQYGKAKNYEGLRETIAHMVSEVGQPLSGETLRDYAIPYLPPGESGIMELRKGGIPVATAAAAMIGHLLLQSDIKYAAKLALQFRANYSSALFYRSVVSAYAKTADLESFITLVRVIVDSNKDEVEKEDGFVADRILIEVKNILFQERKAEKISEVLQAFLDYGIRISSETADNLQNSLGEKYLTTEISNLLSQLTSPDLKISGLERLGFQKNALFANRSDESTLLKAIEAGTAKGESSLSLKRQLLSYYCVNKELEKAEQLCQELKKMNFEFATGSLVHLMDLYIHNDNLPEALKCYGQIFENRTESNPIKIDPSKIIKLGGLMIKLDKFEDAFELFSKHSSDYDEVQKGFNTSSAGWKVLNHLAEKKDPELLRKVFDKLVEGNYIEGNNVTLGPLIKVHLLRDDVDSALATFEECCQKYRATPWKNEIACKLIQKEDPISLQKLTDLSTEIHGEINSLYDLVLSFIECGRIRQARKILETPGLRLRNQRINSACERYNQEGKVNYLENLVEATKDFHHIDRSEIYYHLLQSYCKTDDVDKASGLWTQMQDEDVQPSDAFLVKLGLLLQKHNRPIPFAIPDAPESIIEEHKTRVTTNSQIKEFRKIINSKNLEEALECLSRLKESELSVGDRSKLLNLLLNNGRIGEASKILIDWLRKGLQPNHKTVSAIVNSLAQIGDIDTLMAVGNVLDKDLRRFSSFSNRHAHCMVEAGRVDELLTQLEHQIKSATTEETIELLKEEFPRGGIFSVLTSAPDSLERVEEIAQLYVEKGVFEPANALWAFNFSSGNFEKAKEYWALMNKSERIMFQPVLKFIRLNKDVGLCWDLLNLMKTSGVDSRQLAPVYSLLLDLEIASENLAESERILDIAVKECSIELLSRNSLFRLKNSLEENGKTFKYTLPPRKGVERQREDSSTSSDSDSDSETTQKPRGTARL